MRAHLTLLSWPADQHCFKVGLSMQQVGPELVAAVLLRRSRTLLGSPGQHHVTKSHMHCGWRLQQRCAGLTGPGLYLSHSAWLKLCTACLHEF